MSTPQGRPVRSLLRGRIVPLPSRVAVVGVVLAVAALVVGFQFGRSSAPQLIVFPSPIPSGPAADLTPPPILVQPASVAPELVEAYLATAAGGWAVCAAGPPVRCQRATARSSAWVSRSAAGFPPARPCRCLRG